MNGTEKEIGGRVPVGRRVIIAALLLASTAASALDIYVVGNRSLDDRLLYWKNGEPAALDAGASRGKASSIAVEKGVLYLGGGLRATGSSHNATFWADGKPTVLHTGSGDSFVNALVVKDGVAYSAGYITDPATSAHVAGYWRGTVFHALGSGRGYSEATAMVVTASEVYVAGYTTDAQTGIASAAYWQGEKQVRLVGGSTYAVATSLSILDGMVYAAVVTAYGPGAPVRETGYYAGGRRISVMGTRGSCTINLVLATRAGLFLLGLDGERPVYWLAGKQRDLGAEPPEVVFGATVADGKLHVLGRIGREASVWVDGIRTALSLPKEWGFVRPSAIAVVE